MRVRVLFLTDKTILMGLSPNRERKAATDRNHRPPNHKAAALIMPYLARPQHRKMQN
jgi:hypothetical protein